MSTLTGKLTGDTVTRKVYGTFHLGSDEYAIEMTDLQEVVNAPETLQLMPLAPEYVRGLFSLRGRVLPVVDLGLLLEIARTESPQTLNRRMVVLRQGAVRLGVLFDAIGEVLRVAPRELVALEYAQAQQGGSRPPVSSVICRDNGSRMIQVLDLGALLQIKNLPIIEGTKDQQAEENVSHRLRDLYREKLIGFRVADFVMAMEMKCIAAIVNNKGKRPSPFRSNLCESIIMYCGRMVPVVELGKLLHLPCDGSSQRILVCRLGEEHVGFEVDDVTSIIPYARERVQPVPVLSDYRSSVFRGCFTDRDGCDFIVLNEEGILAGDEIAEISVGHAQTDQKQQAAEAQAVAAQMSLLTFRMGKLYGLQLLDVLEVLDAPKEFARAPDMPDAVLGVFNLRGSPISVLDCRALFDLEPSRDPSRANLLIFEHRARRIAMRVDAVESIISVSAEEGDTLPEIFFRSDQQVMQEVFAKGIHVPADGDKSVILVPKADQILDRLGKALAA